MDRASLFERLYEVTAALSAAATPDEVVRVMFAQGLQLLEADGGFLGMVSEDGSQLLVQRFADYSGDPQQQLEVPIDAPFPIAASARDGIARLIESNERLACDFPGLERINAADHSCATIPLWSGDQVWGALNIAFDDARPFTEAERTLMTLLGTHCSAALHRAQRLQEAEQRLRALRALEIHDDVVQDLAVARLALEVGREDDAMAALTRGLDAAKRIVSEIAGDAPHYRRDI